MYKDMNNVFSTFRSLIIEYLKKPNEQSAGAFIVAIETRWDTVARTWERPQAGRGGAPPEDYLFFLVYIVAMMVVAPAPLMN